MIAFTNSSWINAWTLKHACSALGINVRVPRGRRELPLPQRHATDCAEWLLFTEESSLSQALQSNDSRSFLPKQFPAHLLDDKWTFAEFLGLDADGPQGLKQWSLTQANQARYPVLLKGRHSWMRGRKLPRGWVCKDSTELEQFLTHMAADGLDTSWFFLQEWLGEAPLKLLSVGGFFDATDENRNLSVVTERVAEYGAGPSSSAMLVTVPDSLGLLEHSAQVLRRLRYCGPYELEFIVASDRILALELNPRFWMQHGLFLHSGNGLVKRYFGQETAADLKAPAPENLLWVDGVWLLRRLLRMDLRIFRLWHKWVHQRGYQPVVCPSLGDSVRAGIWRAFGGGRR